MEKRQRCFYQTPSAHTVAAAAAADATVRDQDCDVANINADLSRRDNDTPRRSKYICMHFTTDACRIACLCQYSFFFVPCLYSLVRPKTIVFGRTSVLLQMFFFLSSRDL